MAEIAAFLLDRSQRSNDEDQQHRRTRLKPENPS
jgi:hypothetical protein